MVGDRGGLLQSRIGSDHLPRDQILADAEMFERPLGLRPPKFVGRNSDNAQAVGLLAHFSHLLPAPRIHRFPRFTVLLRQKYGYK